MAGVNVKMGVNGVAEFKKGMKDAQESVKALNEALKLNESQMKLNGESELYMQNKVAILNDKIKAQEQVVRKAQAALDAMAANGTDKASAAYQKMQSAVYKASAELMDMKTDLKNVETGADKAGNEAEEMNNQLKGIGKGVNWSNISEGIDKITNKLQSAARAAINMGKRIVNSAKESTGWADELITLSKQTGISTTDLQKMQNVAEIVDTDVDAIISAQDRMKRATTTKGGVQSIEEVLGISLNGQSADDLFWEIGGALANMGEEFDKEAAAQQVFGRSWRELLPLFKTGREEYQKMLDEQNVLTEEQVENLGKADDALVKAQQELQKLKNEFWSENADKITGLMQWFVDNEGAVVAALTAIGAAFGAMKLAGFAANLAQIVTGFKGLGLVKGAADAASAASGAAGAASGGAGAATGGGGLFAGLGAEGILGAAGLAAIPAAFAWAIDRRRNHAEQVRGTDENFAANVGGMESLMREWITANRQFDELEFTASEAEVAALQNKITEAYQKLSESEEGIKALQAYSDWRQEHSLGNMDWELPDYLSAATEATSTLTTETQNLNESTGAMTEAAKGLMNLPATVADAVYKAVSNVNITISGGAVDVIGRRNSGTFFDRVAALVKP